MTGRLSDHQRRAIERYEQLLSERPELFGDRQRRPIVSDRRTLSKYAADHDVVLGVAAETPYMWLINDLVQSRTAGTSVIHPYLRVIAPPGAADVPGVVVLATLNTDGQAEESVVLVEQERHATGRLELEVPRGFGDPESAADLHALAELRQETGYLGDRAECLGTTVTNSGTSDGSASFYHVRVTGREDAAPEAYEAIAAIRLMPKSELWRRIESGVIRDAFTLQALALYERRFA